MRSSGSSNYLQVHVYDMQSRESSLAHFIHMTIFKFDFTIFHKSSFRFSEEQEAQVMINFRFKS